MFMLQNHWIHPMFCQTVQWTIHSWIKSMTPGQVEIFPAKIYLQVNLRKYNKTVAGFREFHLLVVDDVPNWPNWRHHLQKWCEFTEGDQRHCLIAKLLNRWDHHPPHRPDRRCSLPLLGFMASWEAPSFPGEVGLAYFLGKKNKWLQWKWYVINTWKVQKKSIPKYSSLCYLHLCHFYLEMFRFIGRPWMILRILLRRSQASAFLLRQQALHRWRISEL